MCGVRIIESPSDKDKELFLSKKKTKKNVDPSRKLNYKKTKPNYFFVSLFASFSLFC